MDAWIADSSEGMFFESGIRSPRTRPILSEAERTAAEALRAIPHVFRVYTRTQLLNGWIANDLVDVRVRNGFNAARSPNLIVISDPYWDYRHQRRHPRISVRL